MGLRVGNITVDGDDVLRVARFWSAALERPIDDGRASGSRRSVDGTPHAPSTTVPWAGHRLTVLHDPEGNEFCVDAKPYTGIGTGS